MKESKLNAIRNAIMTEVNDTGLPQNHRIDIEIDLQILKDKEDLDFGYIMRKNGTQLIHRAHNLVEAMRNLKKIEFYEKNGEVCLFYKFTSRGLTMTSAEKLKQSYASYESMAIAV